MSRTALIAKNTLIQILGRAAGTVLGLVTLGIMTRYLGAHGYGEFTTVTTFLQFFGILVDFGLSLTTVAMLSEHGDEAPSPDGHGGTRRDRVLSNLLSLRIISAAVFFAVAPIVVLAFPYSPAVKSGVIVAAASFFFIALNQILTGVLQKDYRMARAAGAEILGRLGLLAGVIAVAAARLPLDWMFAALVAGNALTVLWNWLLVRKLAKITWRIELSAWKEILSRSWPIGMSIAFNLIYLKGDVIVLSLTRTQTEVGLYGAAYKILDVLTVVPIMFMGLVLPLMVKAWSEKNLGDMRRVLQKAFDFMAVLALPLVAGTVMVGKDLMRFFAGPGFDQAGDMLKILIIAGAAVFFGSMFGHAVIAINRQRQMIWGYAIDAALAIVFYIIFIPSFGPTAAAWVTVLSEVFIAFATFFMVYRATRFVPRLAGAAKVAAACAVMMLAIALLPASLHVLAKAAAGAIVYAAAAVIFGVVTMETLKELLPKNLIIPPERE